MLDKQVEDRRKRELKNRMIDLQADNYSVINSAIDVMPNEWNDPGMRYLRKSQSSAQQSNGFGQNPNNLNQSFQGGFGKTTII